MSIKENCANDITMVLGGIFGLALFSGMAQAVTCTPTGVAAAEAKVTFFAGFNICGISTVVSNTVVEGDFLIFKSTPTRGSGTAAMGGGRDYTAEVILGTLDTFELNGIDTFALNGISEPPNTVSSNTVTFTDTGILPAVLVGTFPFGTFRMDLLLVVAGPDITVNSATVSAIPIPAAMWLFVSGLLGLVGIARRK